VGTARHDFGPVLNREGMRDLSISSMLLSSISFTISLKDIQANLIQSRASRATNGNLS
jgi:hypothetical protein